MLTVKTIVLIILSSLGVSIVFWTLDSAIMSQVLHTGTFREQLFQPNMHHLWMRVPLVITSVPIVTLVVLFSKKTVEAKVLSGLLPICAWCKNMRNDEGYWQSVEAYISAHTKAEFTHGLCPACMEKLLEPTDEKNKVIG